jgi:hypothetical protein
MLLLKIWKNFIFISTTICEEGTKHNWLCRPFDTVVKELADDISSIASLNEIQNDEALH